MSKEKLIDLHFHSYYSDGLYSPKELAKKAEKLGLKIISLTDHNGIDGVEEMNYWAKKFGLKNIPGVEIYTFFKKFHLHLLGYNFDPKNKKLNKLLNDLQNKKREIIKKSIKILRKQGWKIDEIKVFSTPAVYVGIDKLAEALIKENFKRVVRDFKKRPILLTEVIGRYFFIKGRLICPEAEVGIGKAIKIIHQAGGKAVLAHPSQQLSWKDLGVIKELKRKGLDGLEVLSSHHRWSDIIYWQKVAHKFNLFPTIGSDFHGELPNKWFFIRSPWDYLKFPPFSIKELNKFLRIK